MYLRADPACADLAATRASWPADPLHLAFSLYADGHLSAAELISVCGRSGSTAVYSYLASSHKRGPEAVTAYLDAIITLGLVRDLE